MHPSSKNGWKAITSSIKRKDHCDNEIRIFSRVVAATRNSFLRLPMRSDLQIRGHMEGMKQLSE